MASTLKSRLREALDDLGIAEPNQAEIARLTGVKPPSVHAWFSGATKSLGKALLPLAAYLGVSPEWLNTGRGPKHPGGNASHTRMAVREHGPDLAYESGSEIELLDARGSCGGGSIAWDMERREPLIREAGWFRRYNVRPEDVFAVFADGDSMADFIVDGDIVIFNRRRIEPRSGSIFLVEHPDGLKIKRLRREIDGSWILESTNPDKRRHPDERVTAEQADLLRIRGEFVYRQGG